MTLMESQALLVACLISAAALLLAFMLYRRAGRHRVRLPHRGLGVVEAGDASQASGALRRPLGGPREDVTGTSEKDVRALYEIACLCNQDHPEMSSVLGRIAELVAQTASDGQARCCRIDFMGSSYWSPGYVAHEARLERPLEASGAQVGSLTLAATSPDALAEMQETTDAVAGFLGQMLGRFLDRKRLDEQQEELQRRQSIIEQTARLAKLGAWEFDPKTATFLWSDEVRRITGWAVEGEALPGQDRLVAAYLREAVEESLRTRKPLKCELPCFPPGGSRRWLQAIGEIAYSETQPVKVIGIVRDMTDEKEIQSRLFSMANHDALTGLPNRRHFLEKFEAALLTRGAAGALLLIDLDNFKDVNDSGGHDVGDALLKAFARRLEEVVKRGVVARLGGDEFAVLLPDIQQPEADRHALALLAKLREPLTVFGRYEIVRLSAGLTTFPADGRDATALLKNADLATYAAKARGRNSMVTYRTDIREASEWRVAVCSEVEEALAANQFVPYYQPKISLKTGLLTGFEALLRWEHPKGLRSPGSILPAFEVPELSRAICSRMLDRIVVDMAHWQAQQLAFGRVAFNASAAEFEGFDLVSRVLRKLRSIGLPPSSLGLEVTETVFLGHDSDVISSALTQLHDAGIEIALDDFGTGYASLTHLQKFPVDVIKIDQSFIRGLSTDSGSQAITSVVLGLGRSLGMKVVAEGVETSEQAKLLTLAGCDEVQGYYFARPMPASEVPGFITSWRGADEIGRITQKAA